MTQPALDGLVKLLESNASAGLFSAPPLWAQTIKGEPASKANSRKLVTLPVKGAKWNRETKSFDKTRTAFIKSEKAQNYQEMFGYQIKNQTPLFCDVLLYCKIYYSTRRPDLDESLIMDCLQEFRVIDNDRQIKAKIILWSLDKVYPRSDIALYPYTVV